MSGRERRLGVALLVTLGFVVALLVFVRITNEEDEHGTGKAGASEPETSLLDEPAPAEVEAIDTSKQSTDSREIVAVERGKNLDAILEVLLRSKDTGAPVVGADVELSSIHWGEGDKEIRGSTGTWKDILVSDDDGRVWFRLPSRRRVLVTASDVVHQRVVPFWPSEVEVDPLAPGEHRRFELELYTEWIPFHGRVLAADGDVPIPGARIEASELTRALDETKDNEARDWDDPLILTTDLGGSFAIAFAPWLWTEVRVTAPGYVKEYVLPTTGHETAESAHLVRLEASATARIRVLDVLGDPQPGLTVGLDRDGSVWSPWGCDWEGKTDADGECTITDLPPNVWLDIQICRGEELIRWTCKPLAFEPGEERLIELHMGCGTNLRGVLLDPEGLPLPDYEIWLLEALAPRPAYLSAELVEGSRVEKARTDDRGEFRFEDLPSGLWWVGPAPLVPAGNAAGPEPLVPLAEVLLIGERVEEAIVTLRASHGLAIRGRVVHSDGTPIFRARVWAHCRNPVAALLCEETDGNGNFVFGPLAPGSFRLFARPAREFEIHASIQPPGEEPEAEIEIPFEDDPTLIASEYRWAQAGETGIVLPLRWAGLLRGELRDAETGRHCDADVHVLWPELAKYGGGRAVVRSSYGEYEWALPPGTYHVVGRTPHLRIAVAEVVMTEGRVTELDLELGPAAAVVVHHEGKRELAELQVLHHGVPVHGEMVRIGGRSRCIVPPGALTVHLEHVFTDERLERVVTVSAGDEAEVAFTFDD